MRIIEIAADYKQVHIMSVDNWKILRYWQYMNPGKTFSHTMRLLPKTIKREIKSEPKTKHSINVVCVNENSGFDYLTVARCNTY